MESKVYWTSVEFHTNEKDEEGKTYTGGMVFAFILAYDAKEAMSKIEDKLISIEKKPFNFEFISPYDIDIEWEEQQTTKHYSDLFALAKGTNEIIFDDFYLYE